jgi:phage tail-like protein
MAVFSVPRFFHKKFAFTVEIPGIGWAGFRSASGLRVQVAKIQHWEGGALAPNQSPGRVTTPDVTLERGATSDLDLWAWMQQVIDASAMVAEPLHERPVSIVQRDRRGLELRRWTLVAAWPTEFEAGEWDNNADENTIEKVVLAVRYPNLGGDVAV